MCLKEIGQVYIDYILAMALNQIRWSIIIPISVE